VDVENKKTIFATLLQDQYLTRENLRREDLLDLFNLMRDRAGPFQFIHGQKNPKWDRFRLFFKSNRNGESDAHFWHTAEYQSAIKLMKEKYLELPALRADRADEEDVFIDYVRGNSPVHCCQTTTRKQFNLGGG
jgi:hypothetical protein